MMLVGRIAAVVVLSSVVCTSALAAKRQRLSASPDFPWLDDKDGVRLEIVEKLIEQKMSDQALSIITDLRNDGVTKPSLDLYQGKALQYQGMATEAERLLVSARKRMPGDARPHSALCILYADNENFEQAIESCQRATSIDKNDAGTWNNYGYLLLFVGDRPDDARKALETAVQLDSTQSRYRNNLGHAQVACGAPADAMKTFMSTATRADAAYNVGAASERFGTIDDAVRYYQQALDQQPDHSLAHEAIERLGKPAEEN